MEVDFGQGAGNQVFGRLLGEAQRHVFAVAVEVDAVVGKREVQRYVGVAAAVFGNPAGEYGVGKPHGDAHAQPALHPGGAACGTGGGLVEDVERGEAVAVVGFALFGEAEAAVVAVEQAGIHAFFQVCHMFAGHGHGNIQLLGGAGEAAAVHHLAEYFHA